MIIKITFSFQGFNLKFGEADFKLNKLNKNLNLIQNNHCNETLKNKTSCN